jgi:predicted ATP-grasp superfamily ATP-dependent carboligase
MPDVLVTGARAPVALDLARAFRAAGHSVQLADSAPAFAARWSRATPAAVVRLPPPRTAYRAFANALCAWTTAHRAGYIVPTCEEVFYVAAAAAEGGFADQVFAPPLESLRRLHSKIDFPVLAKGAGVVAPETWAIASDEDLANCPLSRDALVLKPEFSRFGTATLIRPDHTRLRSVTATPDARWAAQTFIAGEEICLWTAARNGEIVAHAAYRPRWRHGRAAAYAFERVDNAGVLEVARAIAHHLGLTGHLSFDIILTPDGAAIPIECNPRAVSGVHLFDAAPALASAIIGEGPPVCAEVDLRYLGPAMAFLGVPSAISRGRLGDLVRDWRRGADAIGRKGDRLPAIGALADAAIFAAIALSRRRSPAGQTTDDIEWNGGIIA